MANRYWVGGTGTWNTTSTTNWSASSGGASGASVPTSADSVFFDQAATYTVTMTGALTCLDITVSAGTVTFAQGTTPTLAVSGSMTLAAATVWNSTGQITFNATTTGKTVTTNGVSLPGNIAFNGVGGGWTLGSAITCVGLIQCSAGTFDTSSSGNYNVTCSQFTSASTSTTVINLNASTVTASAFSSNAILLTGTALTFNAGTSQINLTGTGAGINSGTGRTFYNVAFTATTADTKLIQGPNTFNNLAVTAPSAAGLATVTFNSAQTINGTLSTTGTAGNRRVFFSSATYGISLTLTVNAAPSLTDADFRGLYFIGTSAPISGTRIGNRGECRNITFDTPKTVYWNLTSGDWSADGWAATSGGAVSTNNFPLPQDTAVINDTAPTASAVFSMQGTLPAISTVDLSARTVAMTLQLNGSNAWYGSLTLGSGVTPSAAGTQTFSGGSTQTITSAGKTFTCPFVVDTYGGTVQLADALNIGSNTLTVTNGTFDTKNFNVNLGQLSSVNTNVRTMNFGSSTITTASAATAVSITSTNLTFNAGTSTFSATSGNSIIDITGGLTFYNLTFSATASVPSINGTNTFNNLTVNAPASAGINLLTLSANQTINGTLTCAGASAVRRIFLQSSTIGTQRTLTVNSISATDCDFRDINLAGTASGASPTRAGDCGNNSGITFPAGKTVYWNLTGAQNWSSTGWATASGGAPAVNNFPLAQDTAKFDDTGAATSVSTDAAWNVGTIDFSARTTAITFTTINTLAIYGNFLNGTGVAWGTSNGLTFRGSGSNTITSNGAAIAAPIIINKITGTITLADALSGSANSLTLTSGTFDAATYNVTRLSVTNSATTNTIKMGSGTWTLAGTGTVWNMATAPTIIAGTSTVVLSDTSTTARTFDGGSRYYNKLTIGGATGTSTLTLLGLNNVFGELASTKTVAHTIALGTNTPTFGKWTVTGTLGNVVTVTGSATLTIAGPAVTGIDYMAMGTVALSTTSPGEFYAGANSTGTGARITFTAAPAARNLYWVGGTGNWSATTSWSTSSGGASGAAIPTSLDTVTFDNLSNATAYTATIDAGVTIARCAAFTMNGPASGNVTFAGTVPIAFHGNVTFAATGITRTYTGTINLAGNSSYTFTTNGLTLASFSQVVGIGATWTLGSAFNIGTNTFTVTYGTFNTSASNYSVTLQQFNSTNSNVRSISLNGSTVNISGLTGIQIDFSTSANLTFTAGTSTISVSSSGPTWNGGGQTFYNVSFISTSTTSILIAGANTFNNLSFAGQTTVGCISISFGANQTINGTLTLSAGTAAAYRNFLNSTVYATQRTLTVNALAAGAADVDFQDIAITGAAAPISGTRFGDAKGNSGITFPAGKTVYYRATGSANWGDVNSWSATSGGAIDATQFPLPQDTAVFPAATYPASGSTTTINANYNIGTIDMSLRTANTMTLATSTFNPNIYGNWITGTGITLTGSGILSFLGRASQTITSAGKTFPQIFSVNSPGGSVTLQDAFSATGNPFTLLAGTFDAATYNVTHTGQFNSSGSLTRAVAFGSGTWTFSGSGNTFSASGTNFTASGSATITFTNAASKNFNGGSFTNFSGITLNQGGAGTLQLFGNTTYKDITNTYSATGAATLALQASTTTLTQFTGTGASGKVLTISGTSAAAPATLILSSGTVTTPDYLTISNVRAYSLATTWYAGANSTNAGSLGWIFAASGGGGTTYTGTITETATGTDSISALVIYLGAIAETATATDSTTVEASTFNAALAETATGTDSTSSLVSFISSLSETATGTDSTSSLVSFLSSLSETATGTDSTSSLVSFLGSLSETATAADTTSSLASFLGSLSETAVSTDVTSALGVFIGTATESATSTDLFSSKQTFGSSVAETGTASDAAVVAPSVFNAPVTEFVTSSDISTALAVFGGVVLESLSASDAVSWSYLWNLISTNQPTTWTNLDTANGTWNVVSNSQSVTWTDIGTTQNGSWIDIVTTDPYEITLVDIISYDASGSTYYITNVNFGDPADSRELFVVITSRYSGTRAINSVTVGGVAATLAPTNYLSGTLLGQAIAYAGVPTGTTGEIDIAWSSTVSNIRVAVYRVTGRLRFGSNATSSANVPNASNVSSLTIPSGATTIPNNGFLIGSVAALAQPTVTSTGVVTGMSQVGAYTNPSLSAISPSTIALLNNRIGLPSDSDSRSISWPTTQFISTLAVWTFT